MKNMKSRVILIATEIFFFSLLFWNGDEGKVFAQNVGINTTGNAPNSSALLDVDASPGNNKGILIPRLPLTASNVGAPISPAPGAAEKGLMVYNTATAGTSPNDVVPGFYYWNGSAWAPLGGGGSTGGGWTDDGTVVRLTTSTDFVGIGTASPASTSALDITSTTKGILIPRMTIAQRDAITTPATGLQVYNTDCSTLDYWTGTCWISTRKSLPDPDPITSVPATTTFCAGQNRTYSVTAIPSATKYGWTVPAGTTINSGQLTNSITVTFGNISGSVCVKASNACETSGQTCLAVNVDPIPNTPGNITGITSINPGQQSVTYFVASVNGASTYTWSVPAGATIASGTGTTTIVVNFACNASSGNISVTANSTCGSSPASALALTITPLLAVNAGSPVFGGTTQTIGNAATGGTSGYTYAWLPTANLSDPTIYNPIAQCTGGPGPTTYTVTVTDNRNCTASSSVLVTRDLTAIVAGNFSGPGSLGGSPNTATGGTGPGTYTYSWTNGSELVGGSSTIANPTAKACNPTTTFSVTVTDGNGCTKLSSGVTVTKNLTATVAANFSGPGPIGGSPTATGGTGPGTYSYSWTNGSELVGGLSTIANPSAKACNTTTFNVTVTDTNACTALSAGVTVTKNLAANAGAGQTMVSGCSKNITGSPTASGGTGTYTYSWAGSGSISGSTTGPSIVATATVTATYTVSVTDGNGCTASSSMTLTVGGTTQAFINTSTGRSGTIQSWTVPGGVTCISIEAWGAQGGTSGASTGGLGARMKGTFSVTPGDVLKILVGQQGGQVGNCHTGGGGGTFVSTSTNVPLIVAGGGGGGSCYLGLVGQDALITTNGSSGLNGGGAGGTGGNGGGGGPSSAGGGGGFSTNGAFGGGCNNNPGIAFINGGLGALATAPGNSGDGGFGGGASGDGQCCGGSGAGGGYSGGGGGGTCGYRGGGGGSYIIISATNQTSSAGVKTLHGRVEITY